MNLPLLASAFTTPSIHPCIHPQSVCVDIASGFQSEQRETDQNKMHSDYIQKITLMRLFHPEKKLENKL